MNFPSVLMIPVTPSAPAATRFRRMAPVLHTKTMSVAPSTLEVTDGRVPVATDHFVSRPMP